MSTLISEPKATKVTFSKYNFTIHLEDGRELSVPFSYFPRLERATPSQLEKYELSGGGIGIHWDELDEDISVAGLLQGVGDRKR
ncbi:MAG: DUF2442 domain-containing protein [Spirochaetia bacterium]|nr:DUF2442 domain-containing protein [Spirochaetia bacterium]